MFLKLMDLWLTTIITIIGGFSIPISILFGIRVINYMYLNVFNPF